MKPFIFGLALTLGMLLPFSVRAAEPAKPAPRCALLDPEKLDRVAILEAKLSADPTAIWVERNTIEQVLKEQQVQALFSANGVGQRAKLGRLLKADVLVLVRRVKDVKEPTFEVVICETAGGLRLLVRGVPESKNAGDDVEALRAIVTEGLKKFSETAKEVVAVPPFLSNNLTFDHDYLKSAFAKLVEQVALTQPGVVAVELAEAEALAKELALTTDEKISRPLPIYFVGEFRHEVRGAEQTVTVKLRAERGGKLIGKPAEWKVKPDAAVGELQKWTAEILAAVAGDVKPRLPTDPKAEAKTLADRARDFACLGQWAESLALNEASLLLDAEPVSVRVDAINASAQLIEMVHRPGTRDPKPESCRTVQKLHRRAWEHLEVVVLRKDDLREYRAAVQNHQAFLFFMTVSFQMKPGQFDGPQTRPIMQEVFEERRDATLRLLPVLAKGGRMEDGIYVNGILNFLPTKERFELAEKIILMLQDLPRAKDRTLIYIRYVRVPKKNMLTLLVAQDHKYQPNLAAEIEKLWSAEVAALRGLIERLATSKNPELRAAAAEMTQRMANEPEQDLPDDSVPTPEGLKLRRLAFVDESSNRPSIKVYGILVIGPSLDVVWGGNLYLMKEKTKLRPIRQLRPNYGDHFNIVRYDGKYIWATAERTQDTPLLLILDPKSEKVWEVTGADGLPQPPNEQLRANVPKRLLVAPLGPGRACVAGSYGRAWVAVVSFDREKEKATVKVIHEAREAQHPGDLAQAANTAVDFQPGFMITLTGRPTQDGKIEQRVVLGRSLPVAGAGNANASVISRPLIIDPDKESVTVMRDSFAEQIGRSSFRRFGVVTDAFYIVESTRHESGRATESMLFRVGWPDLSRKSLGTLPTGVVNTALIHEQRFHYIRLVNNEPPKGTPLPPNWMPTWTSEWWTVGLDGQKPFRLGSRLPSISSLTISSHYGLVAYAENNGGKGELYAVEFTAPPKE